MTVHRDVLKLDDDLLDLLTESVDAKERAIVAAWVVTYDQAAAELMAALDELTAANVNGTVTRAMLLRSDRVTAALQAVEAALDVLATQTGVILTDGVRDFIATVVDTHVAMITAQLPARLADGTIPLLTTAVVGASPEQVAAMIQRVTERMESLTRELTVDAKRAIKTEVLRAITVGANPRVAARRTMARVEGVFDGGIGRAMNLARTEQVDALRAAARAVQDANADVLAGWVWVCHLGPRTCRSCLAMHGRTFDLDVPGPLDHPQGRCARVPRTKTWAELGFTGIKERKPAIPDAAEFFSSLPVEDQVAILGQKNWDAWAAGDFPMDQWARLKTNPGWRDSWVAANA